MTNLHTNEIIAKALEVATTAHRGTTRKETDIPYIVHPIEAALTLQKQGFDEQVIAAALLHDTLEDTAVTEADLREKFNDRIADLVLSVSELLTGNPSWEERKEHTINSIKEAELDSKYIACADKLSNIRSMIRNYEEQGDQLWSKFNRGYEKQQWYYQSLVDSLNELANDDIYQQFKLAVEYLFTAK